MFALVIYIPDPLGRFLDDLRRELVPDYKPHAHVSVLPPRQLQVPWEQASQEARSLVEGWSPFDVELTRVQTFCKTNVIYLEIGSGASELFGLHDAMNRSVLAFDEPYDYHPHITLAQEFPAEEAPDLVQLAKRRWAEYAGPRTFRADRAVFVHNADGECWVDLAEYSLGAVTVP